MKKIIHGVEYELRPIPPSLAPYSARIFTLLQLAPTTIEETRKASNELEALFKDVLAKVVNPVPPLEDELEVYSAVIQLSNQIIEKAGLSPQGNRRSGAPNLSS